MYQLNRLRLNHKHRFLLVKFCINMIKFINYKIFELKFQLFISCSSSACLVRCSRCNSHKPNHAKEPN